MNFLIQFLPVIVAAVAQEEATFATTQGIALLTAENARVNGGLSTQQISDTIHGLVALGLAEQSALVSRISGNVTAAAASSKKLTSAARACIQP